MSSQNPENQSEVILHVAGEGGGYTALGTNDNGLWKFWRETGGSDSWMIDEFDDGPEQIDASAIRPIHEQPTVYFETLDLVLNEINSCWPILHPLKVHHEFAHSIWHRAVNYWTKHDRVATNRAESAWSSACLGRKISTYTELLTEVKA